MCFINSYKRYKIASKNITVYKMIRTNGRGYYYNLYIDGKTEKWKQGYHYTETDFPKASKNSFSGNGFHSYIKKPPFIHYNTKIVEMIIPKGSKYYKNTEEYFSSDLIYPHQ